MQCASSTTSIPQPAASFGSWKSRKAGLFSRSGLMSSTSTSSAAMASVMASHSSRFAELIVRARTPARSAASIWLRIKASSGETMTVGPAPRRRSSAVATKYTADFPKPVRCTSSTRRPEPSHSASIARHWSSRSRAPSPAKARSRRSASSLAVFTAVLPIPAMPTVVPHWCDGPRHRYALAL